MITRSNLDSMWVKLSANACGTIEGLSNAASIWRDTLETSKQTDTQKLQTAIALIDELIRCASDIKKQEKHVLDTIDSHVKEIIAKAETDKDFDCTKI